MALLPGANAAASQHADDTWKVIQFVNTELTGAGVYTSSRLLRGQPGSEWAMIVLTAYSGGRSLEKVARILARK